MGHQFFDSYRRLYSRVMHQKTCLQNWKGLGYSNILMSFPRFTLLSELSDLEWGLSTLSESLCNQCFSKLKHRHLLRVWGRGEMPISGFQSQDSKSVWDLTKVLRFMNPECNVWPRLKTTATEFYPRACLCAGISLNNQELFFLMGHWCNLPSILNALLCMKLGINLL